MPNALKLLLADRFPKVAADLLDPLVRLLHAGRAFCGGDADKFLVLTVVALRTSQHPQFRAATPQLIAAGMMPVLPSLGVNIRSIAESLGIPKETVRRKVQELVADGLVVRDNGGLQITMAGYQHFAPVRAELQAMVARYHAVGVQLLADS